MIIQSGHTEAQIDKAIKMFIEVADDMCYFEFMKTYSINDNPLSREIRKYGLKLWIKSWFIPVDFSGRTPD